MAQFSTYFVAGSNNTLRNKTGINWSHNGQVQQIYGSTEIDKWYIGEISSVSYQVTVEYTNNVKEVVNLLVVATVNNVNLIDYGRISTVEKIINFSVDVNVSYVSLIATPVNSKFNGAKVTFVANYVESISSIVPVLNDKTIHTNKFYSEYGFETSGINLSNGSLNSESLETTSLQVGSSLSISSNIVTINNQGITPGSMNNVVIGNTSPQEATFSSLTVNDNTQLNGNLTLTSNNSIINISPSGGSGTVTISPASTGKIGRAHV
jgi:hypothetical protein